MMFGQKLYSHRIYKQQAKALIRNACMRWLVLAFAGHTYHIVGNLMSRLKYSERYALANDEIYVLKFSKYLYLDNNLPESIHIWNMGA